MSGAFFWHRDLGEVEFKTFPSHLFSAVHFVIIPIRPAVSVRRELPPPMFAPRLTLNGPLFLPLLILFTQALTAAVAALLRSLLPALPFLVRYINGSAVAPNGMVALSSVRVSHTDGGGVIHLMKAAATASLSEASDGRR